MSGFRGMKYCLRNMKLLRNEVSFGYEVKFAHHVRQHTSYAQRTSYAKHTSLARRANFIEKSRVAKYCNTPLNNFVGNGLRAVPQSWLPIQTMSGEFGKGWILAHRGPKSTGTAHRPFPTINYIVGRMILPHNEVLLAQYEVSFGHEVASQ